MKRQSILYRRILTAVLASALLLLHSPATLAETAGTERTYTLGEGKSFSADTDTPTFWEFPQLKAGETRSEGRLTIVNESGEDETIALLRVELPYDDTAALTYLDALHLKVEQGDTIVYDGTYSRVMDKEGGLQLAAFDLENGGSETYTITLSCDFNYTGAAAVPSPLTWRFGASVASRSGGVKLPGVLAVVYVSGGILVLCAILAVVGSRRHRPRQRGDEDG